MLLSRERVQAVDLERLRPFIREDPCFYKPPGEEHYRLLAYLSTCFQDSTLFDIGTHRGDSAIALSYNPTNRVESFDIADAVPAVRRMQPNVTFHQRDLFNPGVREQWRERLLASPLIFLDIDPHEGEREYHLLAWLRSAGYRGLIVLDDIWYFKGMRENLWYALESRHKSDATALGHWSGTGLVSFHDSPPAGDGIVPRGSTANWTLVTGYFDLTRRTDANAAIQARPREHYLEEHAASTLSLDQNLIVFCDPGQEHQILDMRPGWLHERTRVVPMDFDAFPLTRYWPEVVRSRGGHGACARDPRNTASYYLFCMARFAMLKQAIEDNPFQSTHFGWINICIERMGWQNVASLDAALAVQREKFSTCYIDYVPQATLGSLPAFFGADGCRDPNGPCGRCSMCSGFFTGHATHMRAVADLVEQKFVECLAQGYGHADEQLLALVHADHPELFEWYPGDYGEMITNYAGVKANAESPLRNLVRHSLEAEDWATCAHAASLVWDAYRAGRCTLSDTDLAFLLAAKRTADALRAPPR